MYVDVRAPNARMLTDFFFFSSEFSPPLQFLQNRNAWHDDDDSIVKMSSILRPYWMPQPKPPTKMIAGVHLKFTASRLEEGQS